ncbi:MAG: hypothetical protein VYC67_00665, partial [Pseudomonadota bacterium]|nr:hypothetical protein [Pseudomonadota bacterium]
GMYISVSRFIPSRISIRVPNKCFGLEQLLKEMIARINIKFFISKKYHELSSKRKKSVISDKKNDDDNYICCKKKFGSGGRI